MYQLPMLMMTRISKVPRATKSPCAHSADRPYGLSTVSLLVVASAIGAGAADGGAATAAGADAGSWAHAICGAARKLAASASAAMIECDRLSMEDVVILETPGKETGWANSRPQGWKARPQSHTGAQERASLQLEDELLGGLDFIVAGTRADV